MPALPAAISLLETSVIAPSKNFASKGDHGGTDAVDTITASMLCDLVNHIASAWTVRQSGFARPGDSGVQLLSERGFIKLNAVPLAFTLGARNGAGLVGAAPSRRSRG
jgi:hypothetical protein